MSFCADRPALSAQLAWCSSRFFSWTQALLVGVGASLLCFSSSATAAETIVVRFKDAEITIDTSEIAKFANTGFLPEQLAQFLNTHRQIPEDIRTVLTDRIKISSKFVEKNIDSSVGQFALLKLDELIQNSSVREDLESLKAAILKEVNRTGSISLLGLIEAYPTPTIHLNLTGLEAAYEDARHFLEDIEPALAVAKAFLQDIVCDCETQTATGSESRLQGGKVAGTSHAATGCSDSAAKTVAAGASLSGSDASGEGDRTHPDSAGLAVLSEELLAGRAAIAPNPLVIAPLETAPLETEALDPASRPGTATESLSWSPQ